MKAYVGFRDSKCRFLKFLKKGFRHADIILYDDYNSILIVPAWKQLRIYFIDGENIFDDYTKIVECEVHRKTGYSIGLPFINCVKVIKYILGVENKALTPYQLYKELTNGNNKFKSSRTSLAGRGKETDCR